MELHCRFGHIAPSVARQLADRGLVSGLIFNNSKDGGTFCELCVYGKATRKPITKEHVGEHAGNVGNIIWSDIWGPAPIPTLGGQCYYVMFTDDHSRLTYLYSLCQKSSTFEAYQGFEAWLDRQLAAKVKLLHSDRRSEYQGHEFILYLERQGTVQRFTAHDTPQHNEIAKRLNCTILKRVHALLHASGLLKYLWGEAAHHVIWLKNWTPTKVLNGLTPFKVAFGTKPNLSCVRKWGSEVFVRVEGISKLSGRVEKC